MAVYNIFPEKDTFIWSQYPTQNMGMDEILEVSTYNDPSTVVMHLLYLKHIP